MRIRLMPKAPPVLQQEPLILALLWASHAAGQSSRVHRLTSTPETVVIGYYDAATKPVLRIRSGEVVEITSAMIAATEMLEQAGVADSEIKASLRQIHTQITIAGRARTFSPVLSTSKGLSRATFSRYGSRRSNSHCPMP